MAAPQQVVFASLKGHHWPSPPRVVVSPLDTPWWAWGFTGFKRFKGFRGEGIALTGDEYKFSVTGFNFMSPVLHGEVLKPPSSGRGVAP